MSISKRARRRIVILSVGIVSLVVAGSAAYALRGWQLRSALAASRASGLSLHAQGSFEQAMKELSFVAARRPEDWEVLLALAECRRMVPMENGRHLVRAAAFAREAAQASPASARPLALLVDLYTEMGFFTECIDAARRLIDLDAAHAQAHWALTRSLLVLGRADEARAAAEQMAANVPGDIRPHEVILAMMESQGAPPDEIRAYARSLAESRPGDVHAAVLLIRACAATGDKAGAVEAARQAAALPLGTVEELKGLVNDLRRAGLRDEAEGVLKREASNPALAEAAAVVSAESAWKAGDLSRAHAAVLPIITAPESLSHDALGWAAFLCAAVQDPRAPSLRREIDTRAGDRPAAWAGILAARDLLSQGKPEEARARLAGVVARHSDLDVAQVLLGEADRRVGEWSLAADRWLSLVARDPLWITPHLSLVELYLQQGKLDEAHAHALRAASTTPTVDTALALARTIVLRMEGGIATQDEPQTAARLLEQVSRVPPAAQDALVWRARMALAQQDLAEASTCVERLLQRDGVTVNAHLLGLVDRAIAAGVPRANDLLASAQAASASDPAVVVATARQAAREGRHDEAERILRAAADNAEGGERLELEIRLAEFLDERGDARASDELKALSDRRPTSPAAQLAVLESRCAWQHEALVRQAIGRLRDASGPDSGVWRQYEARRLLTFSRQPADAAQAVTLLTEALRRDSTNVAAHLLSAEALLQLDDRAAAVEHLTAAVAAAPESPAVYPALIALLHDLGHTDRANRRLSEFARIKELPDDLRRRRAELARRLARWDLAVEDLERLVQSGTAQDALNLANAHAKLGNADRASELYRQSLEREDRDAAGVIAASDYFAAHDGAQQGLSALDKLPQSVPEPDRTLLRASLLERHGNLDEAEKLYRWAAGEHSSPATWAELGRFLWVAGHAEAARDALARARSIDADDPRVLALGRMLSGGPPGLVDGSPIARDVAAAWDDVRAGGPRAEGGVERLRALAEANPASLEVWAALVEALGMIERHDEAAVAAARAVAALPAEPRATRLATDALERAGRLDEALAMAMQWRSRSLDRPYEPSVAAARLLLITGRVNEAWEMIQPWSERIEREPVADRVATRTLASIHAARGDVEPAGRLVAPALAADAGWLPDYLHVGSWLGEPASHRAWLSSVPESALRAPAPRLLLAQAWFDLAGRTGAADDFARARAEATAASEHPSTRLHATLMLAVCAEQSGESAQAERHYRAALEIDADQPAALNNLAFLLLRNGESTSEAVTLARRACQAAARRGWPDSQRLSLLDTLGRALLANDEPENAQRTFEEGLHIAPTDARFLIGCAESALTLGDAVRAEAALRSLEEPIRSGRCPDAVRLRWQRARERLTALEGLGVADER